jgi:hypothetical protein
VARDESVARSVAGRCLGLADEPGDDHMTTNAVRALPSKVLFHVEVMRQEMKTVKTAPHDEVAAAIEKMEEEINLLFEKASEAAAEMADHTID